MHFLNSLFLSGRIIDIALAVMLAELLLLLLLKNQRRLAFDTAGLIYNLGAGGSLALAVKAALLDDGVLFVAIFLLSALVFHSLDIYRRIKLPNDRSNGSS